MKKLNYLLITLLLAICFTSCDKDDDNVEDVAPSLLDTFQGTVNESDLVGSWEMVGYKTSNGKTTTSFSGLSFSVIYTQEGSNFDYILDINTDPNLMSANGSYDITTNSITNGISSSETTYISTDDFDSSLLTTGWELLPNNTISAAQNGIELIYYINNITENELVLSYDLGKLTKDGFDVLEQTDELSDYEITYEAITTMTFSKL